MVEHDNKSTDILRIKVAGIPFGIDARFARLPHRCRDYQTDESPLFILAASDGDLEEERSRLPKNRKPEAITDGELEVYAIHRKLARRFADLDIFLFHAVAASVDGSGILFVGPSGVGKTTHSRLWKQMLGERMEILNDDKPMIAMSDKEIRIYGSPWCGKERIEKNSSAVLSAVLCVARGETNRLERLSRETAWEALYHQIYSDNSPEMVKKKLDFIQRITGDVPVFRIECNREPEAAEAAYEIMNLCKKR